MNVLLDRHHSGLFHSFQLMARRFGWTLYTPTGHEWWDEWVWNFGRGTWPDDRLAVQYLGAPHVPDDEFPAWPIRFVTLAEARAMDWGYVIATLQDNQHGFAGFAKSVGAPFVYQVGNTGQAIDWSLDPLCLISAEAPIEGRGIRYHQEMDPITFRAYEWQGPDAASFVNCMPSMGPCWERLLEARARGVSIDVYGIDSEVIKPNTKLIELMGGAAWGWHDKAHGDGFGHVLHSWSAVGRPLIGHASHYRGKMGGHFWHDGETCIDLDQHDIDEAAAIIAGMTKRRHREMCEAIRAEFDTIDYDREAEAIADFLGVAVAA